MNKKLHIMQYRLSFVLQKEELRGKTKADLAASVNGQAILLIDTTSKHNSK
jgi:hypothetical protein